MVRFRRNRVIWLMLSFRKKQSQNVAVVRCPPTWLDKPSLLVAKDRLRICAIGSDDAELIKTFGIEQA